MINNVKSGPVEVRLSSFVAAGEKTKEPNIIILESEMKDDLGKMTLGQMTSLRENES